jgi:hypothetical protein
MLQLLRHAPCRSFLAVLAVAGIVLSAAANHGPRIKIFANGELVLDAFVRDNEAVGARNLGNYLNRIAFTDSPRLKIRGSEGDPDRAALKAKFELVLGVNGDSSQKESKPVLKVQFDELRLARSKYNREQWFLTSDGIELIEKAIPEKK